MDFQNNSAIVKYSRASAIHKAHSLDKNLAGLAQHYFGIDLTRLPEMSDLELAAYADRAEAMDKLLEALPILEKHFKTLIDGQVRYEQFISNVQKDTASAAKSIDKNILDTWLLSKAYQDHVRLMGQKASNGLAKLGAETRSTASLELLNFQSALELVAHKHQQKAAEIKNKLPQQIERENLAAQERESAQHRKGLLTYGTKANKKPGGFWSDFWDFFSGK